MATTKGIAKQAGNVSPGTNGQEVFASASLLGQLFTANWRQNFLLAGRLYNVTVGGLTAGGAETWLTGGGAGTTIDQDQPELIIGVDSGYYLFPVSLYVSCLVKLVGGGVGQSAKIIAMGDNSVGIPTSVTGTTETVTNMLDGGPSFPGRAYSGMTADLADPGVEILLASKNVTCSAVGTNAGPVVFNLDLDKEWDTPPLLTGPCSIYVSWGGEVAVGGIASLVVGCVPTTWLPTS